MNRFFPKASFVISVFLFTVSCCTEVVVPSSEFIMGCVKGDANCFAMEKPAHNVSVSEFRMDVHEVTIDDYKDCVNKGVCEDPSKGEGFNWGVKGRSDHPVNGVSWKDADTYCRWKKKRLPTEAEWEKAARAKAEGEIYPWGQESATCEKAVIKENENGCGKKSTWEVCSKPKNRFGLCDMEGNVSEWCSDIYSPDYYSVSVKNDPKGAEEGEFRVFRGGSWKNEAVLIRTSVRGWSFPDRRMDTVGFRCVRDHSAK